MFRPEVWFAVRMLGAVQMMEIPILKSWLHTLVMDGLTQALVDPGKVDMRVDATGPTHEPARARSKANGMQQKPLRNANIFAYLERLLLKTLM